MFLFWRTYFRKSYCFYIWEQHIYWNTFQSLTKNLFSCNKTTSFYWSLKHWNCDHHTYIITPHLAVPPTSKSDPGSKNWFMISLWLFGVDRKSIFWRGGYFVWHIFAMNFWHHDSGPTTEDRAFSSYKPVPAPLPLLLASFMTKILSMRKSEGKVKMPFVNVQHSSIFRKILNKITMYSHCIYHRLDKRKIYTLTSLNCWLISSLFISSLFLSSIQVAQKRTSHKQKKTRKYLVFSNITFVKTRGSKTPTDVGSTLL